MLDQKRCMAFLKPGDNRRRAFNAPLKIMKHDESLIIYCTYSVCVSKEKQLQYMLLSSKKCMNLPRF